MTIRLPGRPRRWNADARQGETHIECRRSGARDDVGANSQPVWRQTGVADPRLQVACEWCPGRYNWSRSRQIQEIAARN